MAPFRQSSPARRLRQRYFQAECLEGRRLLASLPLGATADDTGEFMLGEVLVSVVLLESDGQIDSDLEDWTPQAIARVKQRVTEGLQWWENLLAAQATVHSLEFKLDFTYADNPIATGYEPISRRSDDFELWIEDFFAEVGLTGNESFSDRIRQFNHSQRLAHDTHWAFTVFVVSAEQDADGRFDTAGSFSQSFAYAGGRFFVTTSLRPASSIAHETAHMFWAMDEYAGGRTYVDRRGYYNTQNLNAFDGHPEPASRVRSIMDSTALGYSLHAVSPSGLETIGWKDSDDDGIFDVLDVPLLLVGQGEFDPQTQQFGFEGRAEVQTLPNLNGSGTGNDLTINQVDRIEVRFDQGEWQAALEPQAYVAELSFSVDVPPGVSSIEVRAIDGPTGVTSNVVNMQFDGEPGGWQNLADPLDVNADAVVSPLDALLVINRLNESGARPLTPADVAPPFVDVNGDGVLSPLDALLVINQLNTMSPVAAVAAVGSGAEAESPDRRQACCAADVAFAWQSLPEEPAGKARRRAAPVDAVFGDAFNLGSSGPRRPGTLVLADIR